MGTESESPRPTGAARCNMLGVGSGAHLVPLIVVGLLVSFPRSRLRLTSRVKSWVCRLEVLTALLDTHHCCQCRRRFGPGSRR